MVVGICGRLWLALSADSGAVECQPGNLVQVGPKFGMAAGDGTHHVVGQQICTGSAGRVMFGRRNQELPWRIECVRVPAGGQHSLAEDKIDVLALAHSEAEADIHL
jgi:hypothetical protein